MLTHFLAQSDTIKHLNEQATDGSSQLLLGVNGSARAASVAALYQENPRQMLVVTDTQVHADQLFSDLSSLMTNVFNFPAEESLATEIAISSPDLRLQRVASLLALRKGEAKVIVTSLAGVERLLPKPETVDAAKLSLTVGQTYQLNDIKKTLMMMGYTPTKLVQGAGEFAQRGSIIDIYPLTSDEPIRLDFFDDELDQLKNFDVSTQKSTTVLKKYHVQPATDFIVSETQYDIAKQTIETAFNNYRKELTGVAKKHATEGFSATQHVLNEHGRVNQLLPYATHFFEGETTLLDYFSDDVLVFVDEFTRLKDMQIQQLTYDQEWLDKQLSAYQLIPGQVLRADFADLLTQNQSAVIYLANFQRGLNNIKFTNIEEVTTRPANQYYGQIETLRTDLQYAQDAGMTVILLINDEKQSHHLSESLSDFKVPIIETRQVQPNQAQIMKGNLAIGFEWPKLHLIVLTAHELFTQTRQVAPRQRKINNAERLKSYSELNVGDYVVHINHGIGRYEGLQTMTVDGGKQDYLSIAYQKNAKIFIPVTQLNLIQKYIGASDAAKAPKLNKLGGVEWAKTKRQVAAKIEDIADDLLDLYAKREAQQGYAFPPDDTEQLKFDMAFGYPETPDQIRSIEEIKVDMQKVRPMDRLLVGDVGFGKTEVALRAVFKAVHAGKQVAFLAPTTILVQQHYETMLARFNDFPNIKIGVLSRFQTTAQNKFVIKQLNEHQIDIVVGTHRLLSKDVDFLDLGLLIIDEEQRFGVKHKERLKQLRHSVDVLTLTATPIPRTLNMAMVGARDLSIIETPPANRYPIQTYVLEADWIIVRNAIEKELARGGQVFYLHNRVADIDRVASQIEDLVPSARVGAIHGQMSETQLESVLYDFLNGNYDVLVTTTIIETGVDIPNANTLIVENADHMGLSQLYQLRGRVGRSARLAYAYFTYPFSRTPSEEAEKRLEAIRDFTELGSGFRIAMRDLSIRGAGDILGKQQHGFIDSVGYDMYTKMLKDAVATKQGQTVTTSKPTETDAELILGVLAYLPDTYVPDNAQKIELYTRIRQARTDKEFEEIETDMLDRFGDMPDEVARLLLVGQIKQLADQAQVTNIRRQKQQLAIVFNSDATSTLAGEAIFETLANVPLKVAVRTETGNLQISITVNDVAESSIWLNILRDFLLVVITRQQVTK
ncbi:transcription-repair coupling factor [Leuconostoc gelidum]|uniref:Transcription-repair-coupling factor n=1 Tax=Leuconostoc gelidum subsp. gelidum TaxID=1607839 RepID=A0AB35G2F6_LEUGE|nr:transcription-repair coupling factor [Leuconostoc gelidum]AFS39866.1 transcription-repair coupling factor [Leuconostoc gelidum JB7]MBZ5974780.1 transcription-repair coupling factor [Leuconostoc gelidum subsp. gelidum]MBZ5977620.1 transcription-repair coupling factor [Leuconostoc gelidum subsp. gelidum]MBZ5986442.1 transcription-repair coupling factor [Leuconostoc gelidum subsp. gelidum]MBZ5992033.1 transcription-repair coupling factor [Leuconostoc gelidum subsp. gelidum]